MKRILIYKGEIVPDRTGASAYRITQDILVGDPVRAEQFEGITRPSPRNGDLMDAYTAQWIARRIGEEQRQYVDAVRAAEQPAKRSHWQDD